MSTLVVITICACLLFAFINGFHDGCNVIATIISSRSMNPRKALYLACIAEFIGPLLLGTSVAVTIGKSIIKFEYIETLEKTDAILIFLSAVIGAILWNLFTWWIKMPSSSSHALIGGMLGAGLIACGVNGINWITFFNRVILVLFTSPIIGFVIGYFFFLIIVQITKNMHTKINNFLKKIQIVSMFILGMSHGSNDAQKTVGIIAIVLFISGTPSTESFFIPLWVQLISALMISLGLSTGGWRLIKTVGTLFNIKPIHSFSSQIASATTIITASIIGGPVSTTQIVNSSVMGVGSAERKNAVKWDTIKNILLSWICTIPASALVSSLVFLAIKIII